MFSLDSFGTYATIKSQKGTLLMTAIRTMIFINTLVFIAWNFAIYTSGSDVAAQFMANNFLVSWTGLMEGRYWILFTSVFSHSSFFHLLINMFVLNSFGTVILQSIGLKRFLKFYLVAGVFSSFCHAVVSAWILGQPELPALGASGAIAGIILLFSLIYPKEKILLFGIIPLPAIWGAFAFIGLDIWGLTAQAEGGGLPIGHGAHLGGAFIGILYYLWIRKNMRTRVM
jgi:membrane associated rhomboid family serine protease